MTLKMSALSTSGYAAIVAAVNGELAVMRPELASSVQVPPSVALPTGPVEAATLTPVSCVIWSRKMRPDEIGRDVAAVKHKVAVRLQRFADLGELGGVLADRRVVEHGIAKKQHAVRAMGDDVDGGQVGIGMSGEKIGDLLHTVAIGIELDHLDAGLHAAGQELIVGRLLIDEDDLGRILHPGRHLRHRVGRIAAALPLAAVALSASQLLGDRRHHRRHAVAGCRAIVGDIACFSLFAGPMLVPVAVRRWSGGRSAGRRADAATALRSWRVMMVGVMVRDRCARRRSAVVHDARLKRHKADGPPVAAPLLLLAVGLRVGRTLIGRAQLPAPLPMQASRRDWLSVLFDGLWPEPRGDFVTLHALTSRGGPYHSW